VLIPPHAKGQAALASPALPGTVMMCGNDGVGLVRKGGRGVVRMCPTRRAEVVVAAGGNGDKRSERPGDESPLLAWSG